ncbi:hypothetical protein BG011_006946 [Mortierella polycephala]|uniref:Uncharacterized protein n=1 Tax=Mortierella polycephala TaxID=41804 RepID=A0A9P6PTD9_9FUNG|nr:hypothetical protein BG011_006946 [Mortierella polycephala]
MFERVIPSSASQQDMDEEDDRSPVFYDGCRENPNTVNITQKEPQSRKACWTLGLGQRRTTGDIHVYVDRSKNTLMLQHAFLYDTQEMLTACQKSLDAVKNSLTSPDMNLDTRMISVLLALSNIKRHIMQELDRFMTICWDRIGVLSPDQRRQHHPEQNGNSSGVSNNVNSGSGSGGSGGHSGRGANSIANIFTPGKCVPVMAVVIERVPIATPWYEPGATQNQISLRQQVLKKSIDATQTRLRYVFRACRLIQSIDPPTGLFDAGGGSEKLKKQGPNAMSQLPRGRRERNVTMETPSLTEDSINTLVGIPTLRELYDAVVQAKDQPLHPARSGSKNDHHPQRHGSATKSGSDAGSNASSTSSSVSLGSLYREYSGPLLRQFVEGWIKTVTTPGGYGSVVGKRNAGTVEIPTLQQWIAGYLGVCEALGITFSTSPIGDTGVNISNTVVENGTDNNGSIPQDQSAPTGEDTPNNKISKLKIGNGGGGGGGGGGRRSGNGKRYSQRCANMVQKRIQDFVQTDGVMEELYGQNPDLATTATTATTTTKARAHSERYHQLKADQATKLFQSLAHRR